MIERKMACLLLLALAFASGCIAISADVDNLNQRLAPLTFEESANFLAGIPLNLSKTIEGDITKELAEIANSFGASIDVDYDTAPAEEITRELLNVISSLKLTHVRLNPGHGVQSLQHITTLKLEILEGEDANDSTITVVDYHRTADATTPDDGSLTLEINDGFDHAAYMKRALDKDLRYRLSLRCINPGVNWEILVDLALSISFNHTLTL